MQAVPSSVGRIGPAPTRHTRPRSPRPILWREIVLGLAVFGLYSLVAELNGSARARAGIEHARDVLHLERWAGIDVERSMNRWLLPHDLLRLMADYEYAFTYILSAFLLLAWLYVRRPEAYRWARTSFVLLNLGGIACFAVYPVAPPRLLPASGFVDTVADGQTFGSWGSTAVDHANSLAAMPSLHFGWALWVSVVLGVIAGSRHVQLIGLVHVGVTLLVILVTANHYLLDAAGGAILVGVSIPLASLLSRSPRDAGRRLAPADAFFLYVDTAAAPQQLGGLLLLDVAAAGSAAPTREQVEAIVRERIDLLPRFRQRLSPPSRWRRQRWLEVDAVDWEWHVTAHRLTCSGDGQPSLEQLNAFVAELQATPLPKDRPLWRVVVVHGIEGDRSAVVLLLHHVIADGLGTVEHALQLLDHDPDVPQPRTGPPPGRLATIGAIAVGLGQLATDGKPGWRPRGVDSSARVFGTVNLPLDEVRSVARQLEARVSDVLLALVSGAVSRTTPGANVPRSLRVSMTLLVPRSGPGEGNATGAAMLDIPLGDGSDRDRLDEVARASARLRSGTRAIASRFVMDRGCRALPPVAHAWFARTVYGHRFFHAIVSNMPGPRSQLWLAGLPMTTGYPILPLAPGAPLAVGGLGVTGRLGIGISAHPGFVPDVEAFQAAMHATYDELRAAARHRVDVNQSSRVCDRSLDRVPSTATAVPPTRPSAR